MLTFTEILPGLLDGKSYLDVPNDLIIHMEEGPEGRIVHKISRPVGNFSKTTKVSRTLTKTQVYHLDRNDFTVPKFREVTG